MQDERLKDLLSGFYISDSQQQEIYRRLSAEVRKGLAKDTHAQADVKCFVTCVQDLPTGEELSKYLALDLGGTNFRVLLVTLRGHHDADVQSHIYAVPKEIMLGTGTQLFDHIADCLAAFVREHKLDDAPQLPLGFTFSFPCVQLGLTKALLARWTKGFKCANVEQEDVVRLLREAIDRRGDLQIDVMAVLNDTTGTLMSCAHRNADCRIGLIVGTGCNACYVEKVECVEMLESDVKQNGKRHMIVNTEWGAFGESGQLDFIRTTYDRQVDEMSLNAGSQLYEKMISGMHLGELVRLILIRAVEENLIFAMHKNKEKFLVVLSNVIDCFETRLISEIEADSFPEFQNTKNIIKELFKVEKASVEDCNKLKIICESVSQRAAQLVGIGVSVLINKIADTNKIVVGVDGSVYRFHPHFDSYMRQTIQKLVPPSTDFELMLSEDGSGRGAALVAAVASKNV